MAALEYMKDMYLWTLTRFDLIGFDGERLVEEGDVWEYFASSPVLILSQILTRTQNQNLTRMPI